jgi:hypothetical protein
MEDMLVFVITPLLLTIIVLLFVIANKLTNGSCWRVTKIIAAAIFWVAVVVASASWRINHVGWDVFCEECVWGVVIVIGLLFILSYGYKVAIWLRVRKQLTERDVTKTLAYRFGRYFAKLGSSHKHSLLAL